MKEVNYLRVMVAIVAIVAAYDSAERIKYLSSIIGINSALQE
jgi:hypothetical protein